LEAENARTPYNCGSSGISVAGSYCPEPCSGGLWHYGITVRPRDLVREEFYITSGSRVVVIFYVYSGGSPSDIIFRIVAPDGREVYPRGRIEGVFEWSFTATQSGRYVLEFDNTYSILSPKTIDLARADVSRI
jgi:hypothetical protein